MGCMDSSGRTTRLHYLQHVPFEGLGSIEIWGKERGFEGFVFVFSGC